MSIEVFALSPHGSSVAGEEARFRRHGREGRDQRPLASRAPVVVDFAPHTQLHGEIRHSEPHLNN